MFEITVLGAVKAPSTSFFFVKKWPSIEFEFETPALDLYQAVEFSPNSSKRPFERCKNRF